MKVRLKKNPAVTGSSSTFNTHGLGEMIVGFTEGDMDSQMISDYEVFLEKKQEWKDMSQAFADKDLIPDNYNCIFAEPADEESRERGWFP
jgi:hypothetical protein